MKNSLPQTIYLKDYTPPNYLIETCDLYFNIFDDHTLVTNEMKLVKNPKAVINSDDFLKLDGVNLELITLSMNEKIVPKEDYEVNETSLTLKNTPDFFTLKIETKIYPEKNFALEGLYKSGSILCTQMEAQGFRKVTYYLDRPDVMASFTTTIEADKNKYPYLLSNGDLISNEILENNRQRNYWKDPFKKPCYLFALVAGDLEKVEDFYETKSGKRVTLQIFVDKGNEDRCDFAMQSLKKSMEWDEKRFDLEYDLNTYMIVAVDSFNMGAMENKGLNIFNSGYVLATPKTTTDTQYVAIESVIGHEYFHNWTGNRVTCRDWFQLTLKEGLTVFRDQEFTSDIRSRAVTRIDEVNSLRSYQFPEDAGPMAHPIRPSSYMEINNFYTSTVYNKGAEVIRMIHTIIGEEAFQQGMKRYFELFDGQAVTTEDFIDSMAWSSKDSFAPHVDKFKNWYSQAGTPTVKVQSKYENKTLTLSLSQSCEDTPGQTNKSPFFIPINFSFLDTKGKHLSFSSDNKNVRLKDNNTGLILFFDKQIDITFENISEKPNLSLLRDYSAPVYLEYEYSYDDFAFFMASETDPFNRWEASQKIYQNEVEALIKDPNKDINPALIVAVGKVILDKETDPALLSRLLSLPSISYLSQFHEVYDPYEIYFALKKIVTTITKEYKSELEDLYAWCAKNEFTNSETEMGYRALKNKALLLLSQQEFTDNKEMEIFKNHYFNSKNMTDQITGLGCFNDLEESHKKEVFDDFYKTFKDDSLTINKWFSIQAVSSTKGTLEKIKTLSKDPVFNIKEPNKCYALFRTLPINTLEFHNPDGSGYDYYTEKIIEIDKFNPQVASRLVSAFNIWKKLEPKRSQLMQKCIEKVVRQKDLSKNTFEIASKALDTTA